ncbi:MAG: HD domain-containing phosphohydrolase [bacterium]
MSQDKMEIKYNILIVDDELDNLQLFKRTFRKKYNLFLATSGFEGLEVLKNNKIHMIITDQKMPKMEGVEFLKYAIELSPDSIRMLVTGYTDAHALISAINSGKIYRYIKKPWNPDEIISLVDTAMKIYQLNADTQLLANDLKDLFSGTINAIIEALDAKDSFTLGRSKRVTFYSTEIGKALGMTDVELSELELAGLLHDIGMIGIPETILNKPEYLTQDEFFIVKKHVTFGVKILSDIKQLESIIKIIEAHHEKFDGSGYPKGLKEHDIPMSAAIIAVADAYDSMTSERAYRKGLAHHIAVAEISKNAGTQFNPVVVDGFLSVIDNAVLQIKKWEEQTT